MFERCWNVAVLSLILKLIIQQVLKALSVLFVTFFKTVCAILKNLTGFACYVDYSIL